MGSDSHREKILIVDFGSQTTQLIARRVRQAGVYCEIYPFDVAAEAVRSFDPAGIVLSGGPETVTGVLAPRISDAVLNLGVPILGICYGMQALAIQLGGAVEGADRQEFGHARVELKTRSRLLGGQGGDELNVWMSHGDRVTRLPPGFVTLAGSRDAPIAAMMDDSKKIYGLQFHPEVTHTQGGEQILRCFARDICGCSGRWTPQQIIAETITAIRHQVGAAKVILGLSGGVDSSVVAALVSRAIGDQLTCVFVDTGLLRIDEGDEVEAAFAKADSGQRNNGLSLNLVRVNAADEFLRNLAGVSNPEQKRKIIGTTFVDVFEREASRIDGVKWLAQGTIYPDVIESAAARYGKAQVIKSHHNVGGLPQRMNLKLLEPLRELFKDEVRQVGSSLGLPKELISRHPFPGPGLAVRILGEVTSESADHLRRADAIFLEELHRADYYHKVSQAFAVFLPVKSVGVVGDARRYEPVIALRAVETTDFMTARWAQLPFDLLARVSNRIINEISNISRVVYDISSKPPATIEWE